MAETASSLQRLTTRKLDDLLLTSVGSLCCETAGNIQPIVSMQTLKYLGDVHVALKNKPLASKFYNRALKILRKRLGSIDQTVKQLEQYIKQLNLKD